MRDDPRTQPTSKAHERRCIHPGCQHDPLPALYPDAPVEQLGAESAVAALADADLSIQDAQALYAGNV